MPFPPYDPGYTLPDTTIISFTSKPEMERLLSFKGVFLHLDDLDISDPNYVAGTDIEASDENMILEIIQRVTSKIMEYLAPRFEASALEQNTRIREIATYWACHDLSRRRGNEPLYEDEVAQGLETLERYREGSLYLDAISSGPRTYVQSYITDSRYFRNPTRVLPHASTKTVTGQRLTWQYPFFWL